MTLRFSDGMSFDTTGPLRVVKKADGWYVVGDGLLDAVSSQEAGCALVKQLQSDTPEGFTDASLAELHRLTEED